MFKMFVEIHEELENTDDEYTDKLWFEDIDQNVFSFKYKVHKWKYRSRINQENHPKVAQSQV